MTDEELDEFLEKVASDRNFKNRLGTKNNELPVKASIES